MKTLVPMLFVVLIMVGCEKNQLDQRVKELCAMDGGVRVYEVAPLTPDLLDKTGRIQIPTKEDVTQRDKYFYISEITYLKKGNPQLIRMNTKIIRLSDKKILGEIVRYGRGGGDPPGPWHPSSYICPSPTEPPYLEASVFVKGETQ